MFGKKKPKQTTFCYCQNCRNELCSSGSFMEDTDLVRYVCSKCQLFSEWLFDAPAPILIRSYGIPALRKEDV